MYPPSPFAVPIGSFQTPVQPPSTDPSEGPLFYIPVNCDWMPYVAGALQQLLLQTTWAGTPDEIALAQNRAFNIIAQFNCMTAKQLNQLCPDTPGEGCDDCMGCCVRFQNGVLQTLDCGVWVDVPGQPEGGIGGPTQPGPGAPQAPAGGCVTYHAAVDARGSWLMPTLVNTGDILTPSAWQGATTDVGPVGRWNCYTGLQFALGTCQGSPIIDGSAYAPSLPIGIPLFLVGGVYYDARVPLTVPGSIVNAPLAVLINYAPGGDYHGNMTLDIEFCNNQAVTFTHVFDFTLSDGGWVETPQSEGPGCTAAGAVYTAGVGWALFECPSIGASYINVGVAFTDTALTSVTLELSLSNGNPATSDFELFGTIGSTESQLFHNNPPWPLDLILGGGVSGTFNHIRFRLGIDNNADTDVLVKATITGTGTDPF